MGNPVRDAFIYLSLCIFGVVIIVFCCNQYRRRRHNQQNMRQRGQHTMIYSVTMQGNNASNFYNALSQFFRTSNRGSVNSRRSQEGDINSQNFTSKPTGPPSYEEAMSNDYRGHTASPPPYSEIPIVN